MWFKSYEFSKHRPLKKAVTYQWLDSVGMHLYAKIDQNIPYGSSVMNIFTNWLHADGQTQIVIMVQTQESCNNTEDLLVNSYVEKIG